MPLPRKGGPLSIAEKLKNSLARDGKAPPFQSVELPSTEDRRKRVRYWAGQVDGPMVLPWISLNPSGKRGDGRGSTGTRIANFAWRWGFDGVAVYNIYPFSGSKPKNIKKQIVEWRGQGDFVVRDAVAENHRYIVECLRGFDAALVAWGAQDGQFGAETLRWAKGLVSAIQLADDSRNSEFETWCIGMTKGGHPRHPSPLGRVPADTLPERYHVL
ncbi:DUF1643 domain-containing protein [Mesorhizobium sp. M0060]|uniref:DUF1643 domain-containing protein n=1 Tax=Mesorhizobium sp. M0060 TaxID=2956866 RepID=UPI00333CFA96